PEQRQRPRPHLPRRAGWLYAAGAAAFERGHDEGTGRAVGALERLASRHRRAPAVRTPGPVGRAVVGADTEELQVSPGADARFVRFGWPGATGRRDRTEGPPGPGRHRARACSPIGR